MVPVTKACTQIDRDKDCRSGVFGRKLVMEQRLPLAESGIDFAMNGPGGVQGGHLLQTGPVKHHWRASTSDKQELQDPTEDSRFAMPESSLIES